MKVDPKINPAKSIAYTQKQPDLPVLNGALPCRWWLNGSSGAGKGVVLQNDDLLRANKNRQMEEEGSATGLDNALNMLGMEEKEKSKNLKVLFNEFSERETPKVRADNPGLKLSQVKERVFRAWEKSPDNPKNQQV